MNLDQEIDRSCDERESSTEYSTINLELNRRRKECLDKFAIERANKLHAAYLKELKLDDDSTSISNPIRYRESNSRGMVRKE